MASLLNQLKAHPAVAFVDDERSQGNSIIVTLKAGFEFSDDPGCGVRGEDTMTAALKNVRAYAVQAKPVAA